jgi:hypothetical protein
MNVLDDLLARNVPHRLLVEPRLRSILADLRERLDIVHRGHIEELVGRVLPDTSSDPNPNDS